MRVKSQDEIMVIYFKELPKKRSDIFRIDPHAAFAAPDEDENMYMPINFPL